MSASITAADRPNQWFHIYAEIRHTMVGAWRSFLRVLLPLSLLQISYYVKLSTIRPLLVVISLLSFVQALSLSS